MDIGGGGRKILPRLPHSFAGKRDVELGVEPVDNGEEGVGISGKEGPYSINLKQWRPAQDDEGPKRKRQHIAESRAQSQALPGVQHLLTVPTDPNAIESQMTTPCRLVRNAQNGLYYNHGAFIFSAPSPGRDFPRILSHDTRELSFAVIEPELMDIFKHTWYLRQYVRQRRSQGMEIWWDHVMLNDCGGIDNSLHLWSSRYEPGSVYYPASMLYKHALWLYFNRSIQPSMATTGFRTVVDDGVHYLQSLEKMLGNVDRSFLLVPIFLLGTTAFEARQRGAIFRSLERVDPTHQIGIFGHAMHMLELIWGMMDDGRASATWDWERLQDPAHTQNVLDKSLVDLLQDPFMPVPEYRPSRVRSPEAMPEFDNSRFRAAPMPQPTPVPPVPETALNTRTSSGDTGRQSPSQDISPTDASQSATVPEASEAQLGEMRQERTMSQPELAPAPRPFLAPPPPSASGIPPPSSSGIPHPSSSSMHSNAELLNSIQALNRSKMARPKSGVPPCPTCGKELKNPSDAQKHYLQHSKPFLCREPGCTRIQGFATENDLQRHRKSVHGASPRIGNKIGYVCVRCPVPSDGTSRKWWPRLDNFKAHIRRKHHGADEESLIQASAEPRRPPDTFTDSGYYPGSVSDYMQAQYNTPDRHHQLSIASQASDMERSSEQPTQDSQAQRNQHADQSQGGDGDDEEEEEEEDDGPVGPWELSRSFRSNGKRPLSPDGSEGEGEEDESPTMESSRSGSKQEDATPKAAAVEAEKDVQAGEEENAEDRMDVDTAEEIQAKIEE